MTHEPGRQYSKNGDTKASVPQGPMSSKATEKVIHSASMFDNANHPHISGGEFHNHNHNHNTTNISTVNERPLEVLRKRVASNAILNVEGRADEVRCHPGTRKEVIGRVDTWRREALDGSAPPIFWLSGPAGAGKSAIVQTVAEGWNDEKIPQANFFFFRADPSRNSLSPLTATLVHQIILLYPVIQESIETVLSKNPLILDCSAEEQMVQLIINPLNKIRESKSSSSYRPPVFLIDGLDECDSERKDRQQKILHALDNVLAKYQGCFYLLVASRDEPQIRAAFNQISTPFLPLYLADDYSADDDIRLFVNDEFKKIKKSHPLAHTLDESWPPSQSVDDIVAKSSGQFIYADTVMRFIANASNSPALSLERVQRAEARTATKSPFPQLDAIYNYILSRVDSEDREPLRDTLHVGLLIQRMLDFNNFPYPQESLMPILQACNPKYTEAIIQSCLSKLTPLCRYKKDYRLQFYHASFPDYLMDRSRSGDNFVDINAFNFKVQPLLWEINDPHRSFYFIAVSGLFRLVELPPNFLNTVVALKPIASQTNRSNDVSDARWELRALVHIHTLCSNDDDFIIFACIMRAWCALREDVFLQIYTDCPKSAKGYLEMMFVESSDTNRRVRYWRSTSDVMVMKAFRLESVTDLDARKLALWLNDLLHRIHRETYGNPDRKAEYKPLLKKWIVFALAKNVPLDVLKLDDLPGARRYFWECKMVQWIEAMRGSRWGITIYELLCVLQLALLGAQIL